MKGKLPGDIWREFVQAEVKSKPKLGKLLEASVYGGYENKILTIYFSDDVARKAAQGQSKAIKDKLREYRLLCDHISFMIGVPKTATPVTVNCKNNNPLQALYWVEPNLPAEGDEAQRMQILNATVEAEQACNQFYTKLNQRTLDLAGSKENTIKVSFNWRVRVGGTRGFRELLLPVLHPVFGIPYIPASTLKGAASAWAKKHGLSDEVKDLLGMLHGKIAKAAKVEFLDAFPAKPCLSVDVATPQWTWQNNKVIYQPVPHPLLSLQQPEFLIGLRPTTRGDNDQVKVVKEWLENALKSGIGSRVSSGYGRALGEIPHSQYDQSYSFELWTQGMYGSHPPSRENRYQGTPEFRPTALRGVLRYWFRAVALGLYDIQPCQNLEETLFGKLGQQGKISVNTKVNPPNKIDPYFYTGKIYVEATETQFLNLVEKLLILASHLGGIGRGCRRPLHLLNDRMRGCHWEVMGTNLPLAYNADQWQKFFEELKQAFQVVQAPIGSYTSHPGKPKHRQQDALDKNAQIWLFQSPSQVNPHKVSNWKTEGDRPNIRGTALNLLYSDIRFKGESKGQGNPNVGGALETPSFVWIKSIFPTNNSSYQVITIFGSDHQERQAFAKELKKQGAILVFGQMQSGKLPAPRK